MILGIITFVLLPEAVDPEAEAVVEAEPGVLADDDVARAYYPVRLLPDHRRLACERGDIHQIIIMIKFKVAQAGLFHIFKMNKFVRFAL